ncbi:MAG TPA: hypothetical protein IAA21_00810 [Candidatus Blautia faecigallinarum]|uniref:Uncharacterized protein n=1 Tax=Candidatus Blautia faecigallinarum TaxID=2838488 RepID=A0A9D2DQQ9_9FIRM|nr:hypothetical protein [Candidatus Blautia faecigallinarum]
MAKYVNKNIMLENKEFLIDQDNIVGDGDLGLTMSDGFLAVYESIEGKASKSNSNL